MQNKTNKLKENYIQKVSRALAIIIFTKKFKYT